MIRKLKIQNYKCLQHVELDLRDRNVFIGPNKSGKSSLLDLFRFVSETITSRDNLTKIVSARGGFGEIVWKGSPTKSIRIKFEGIELGSDESKKVYDYELALAADAFGHVAVEQESLLLHEGGRVVVLVETGSGKGHANKLDGTSFYTTSDLSRAVLSYETPDWAGNAVRDYIKQWQFFDLVPQLARIITNPAAAHFALDPMGSNLSSWLHTIQSNYPDDFRRILDIARDAFPEVESITTSITPAGTTFLSFKERHLQSPVPVLHASGGDLKFLALLSIILSPIPVPLVCIEEPENHLHPRLLQLLVDIANQRRIELAGEVSQAFVTTHSPYLVDRLDPEDIVVVEKTNGATTLKRPSSAGDLRKLMKEYESTLGELWFHGALGGV